MGRVAGLMVVFCCFSCACGSDDAGGSDAGSTSDGGDDAGARCGEDLDCDDGLFCTGTERCVERRCEEGDDPCEGDQTCEEPSDSCVSPGDWTPPIGIPAPPFGVRESNEDYEGEEYDYDTGRGPYRDAGNGPYTHFVHGPSDCTDADNPHGTPESPRCTVPSPLPAGSVVEVHGGPYVFDGDDLRWTGNGTEDRPVFVRGIEDEEGAPLLDVDEAYLAGSFFVVEQFRSERCRYRFEPDAHHVSVRHNEISGHPTGNGVAIFGESIVLWDNHIHHHQGDDRHGIAVVQGSANVWILDNLIHHNGGDGIQFCHRCADDPPEYVYVGRNTIYSNRENGIDLKYARHVVASQNLMWGHRPAPAGVEWCFDDGSGCGVFSSGSDGSSAVVGSDGAPEDVWFLFNEVRDSTVGIRIEEAFETWLVGNVIHGVERAAIALEKRAVELWVVANTIHSAGIGIDQSVEPDFQLHVHDNVFANLTGLFLNIEAPEVTASAEVDDNLFWAGGDSFEIRWERRTTVSSGDDVDRVTGGAGNVVGDPAFLDAASGDFDLGPESAAIDAGREVAVYDTYFARQGVDVSVDFLRRPRPAGDGWDIGAFERPAPGR